MPHDGLTPQQQQVADERAGAEVLASRICVAASIAARSECELLELVAQFDACGAIRWWTEVKSLAHWLGWACSMSPGVAREHVRVARALRRMPAVLAVFREGRLSYSKIREVTRVVGVIEEERLVELALTATASQLARMIGAFRAAAGSRITQQAKRTTTWSTRADGMLELRAVLPPEEGAVVLASLAAAHDQFGAPPDKREPGAAGTTPAYSQADALLDVARVFLDTAPEDRSGEDRRLVVVHVSAAELGGAGTGDVPAGTSVPDLSDGDSDENGVPAGTRGTSGRGDPTCHVEGVGSIESETARRLACDATLLGAVVSAHGDVLALRRTRRLVSRAQRRALVVRDRMCQFPGCHQTRHLEAHHRVAWAQGGATDLVNLVLLCQWHHTAVHEGGMSIRPTSDDRPGWRFVMPDGSPLRSWWDDETLKRQLAEQAEGRGGGPETDVGTDVSAGLAHALRPRWVGKRFDLHACVEALFTMRLPQGDQDAA